MAVRAWLVVPLALVVAAMTLWQSTQAISSGLEGLEDTIVFRLNLYRGLAGGSNMLQLRWNTTLEQEAARWTNSCRFEHQEGQEWGEVLYRTEFNRTKQTIVYTGLYSWYLERAFFNIYTNSCCAGANSTRCCNYQQLIWARTRDVGCSLIFCPVLYASDVDYTNAWFFGCYFSPRGNVEDEKAFIPGPKCTNCPPTYTNCSAQNLCAPPYNCP